MKPLRLAARPLDLELKRPFRISRGASRQRRNALVEVDDGRACGRGEAAPIRRYDEDQRSSLAALELAAAKLDDPSPYAEAAQEAVVPGERAAMAALDLALHDLAGKRLGVPLFELLGHRPRPIPPTSITIGLDSVEEALAQVRDAGEFEVLKVKMGAPEDLATLAAIRESTRQLLRVDANEGWSYAEAEARLPELARLGVELVEQPLPAASLEEIRALRQRSPIPFVADESARRAADLPRLVGAFDVVNIKLSKCGGIAEARRMIAVARALGLGVMLGCMIESSLGITAALHLAPLVDFLDLDSHLLLAGDPFEGARFERGRLALPEAPGLGVEPRALCT